MTVISENMGYADGNNRIISDAVLTATLDMISGMTASSAAVGNHSIIITGGMIIRFTASLTVMRDGSIITEQHDYSTFLYEGLRMITDPGWFHDVLGADDIMLVDDDGSHGLCDDDMPGMDASSIIIMSWRSQEG